jgi:hypothetical protein
MDKVDKLYGAIKDAEEALGDAIKHYRYILGCCSSCGDLFEVGSLAIVMVGNDGMLCFEHENCPEDSIDVRDSYRNATQSGPLEMFIRI